MGTKNTMAASSILLIKTTIIKATVTTLVAMSTVIAVATVTLVIMAAKMATRLLQLSKPVCVRF